MFLITLYSYISSSLLDDTDARVAYCTSAFILKVRPLFYALRDHHTKLQLPLMALL